MPKPRSALAAAQRRANSFNETAIVGKSRRIRAIDRDQRDPLFLHRSGLQSNLKSALATDDRGARREEPRRAK